MENLEQKLMNFIDADGESVTIPKNILNDFLIKYSQMESSLNEFLNSDLDKVVLKHILDNIDSFAPQLFNILSSDIIDMDKLSEDLNEKYNKIDLFNKCIKLLVRLNGVNRFFNNAQFMLVGGSKPRDFYEKDLEKYLIKNLNKIEEGLIFIKNQVPYINEHQEKSGSIDILAKDKNNNICVIELKVVNNDRKIIFQCNTYPNNYKNSRMIVVAPSYSNTILEELNKMSYVEKYVYSLENNDLSTIQITKL